jgi:hypothetical protein
MLDAVKHIFLVAGLVFAAGACKEPVGAHVRCEVLDGLAAACTVKQTKGTAELDVCWDFKVTCHNEATYEPPRNCAKVKDGGSTIATTPKDKIVLRGPNGECDTVKSAIVSNVTVNGETLPPAK